MFARGITFPPTPFTSFTPELSLQINVRNQLFLRSHSILPSTQRPGIMITILQSRPSVSEAGDTTEILVALDSSFGLPARQERTSSRDACMQKNNYPRSGQERL